MKFILISMMLANPITYADKSTCEIASKALNNFGEAAICIPAGEAQQNSSDRMFKKFFNLVEELNKIEKMRL
jgi:hypothetical protein|tara:strand:- start:297 stop:512 length:216 start_codon:yes stop_codon:yes gene_type:complete